MIKQLYIKDFALIDELEVAFEEGLNIMTGQTGAGKSIIIGALNMILGERADTDVIRRGADKAISEATIRVGDDEELRELLEANEVETGEYVILRREIRSTGSRAFINDTPVNIGVLKQAGDLLVDLHGQHDHQLLLKEENHLGVIDGFGEIDPILKSYQTEYKKMGELKKELKALKKKEHELQEKTELYRFQVKELEEARLGEIDLDELEGEMNLLDNAEVLDQKAAAISEMGDADDANIIQLLNFLKLNLEDLARIEPEFENYLQEINAARVSVNEAIAFAERYRNSIEFNPQRLEDLRKRQSELNRLQKKYQRDLPDLIQYLHDIQRELSIADNFDLEIEKMEGAIEAQSEVLKEHAISLHQTREKIGEKLAEQIQQELAELGIPHSKLDVRVDWMLSNKGWIEVDGKTIECTENGCDDVRLFISTNKGEEPKPLAKIASGGEISRVMLALKSILAKEQSLPVMIFDEIDTGISGEISEKVGVSMRRLSKHCQIVAITHQPQIASQAHKHYKVAKAEEGDRTVSHIIPLSEEEHIREIASLMSGSEITDSALNSARELIEKNTFRN
ncbi:DNA repair protein RecN [Gracilimonas mengyeensis]|uniref:DNA repair protein RecN n=1 Tax=Gracilimonas mengyeensis TaxID=1302730 RepID=A0A521CPH1_9BACT|nr:DNA repair protein RecN [Gracilimonas mengyeensis]SMO60570.1 DNA replication and repair protein RecN [Gracilimonas mengyeensis]